MCTAQRLGLFQACGVELEYMIVDRATLDVRPIADELFRDAAGGSEYVGEFASGDVSWSNELVAHVVELKTTEPAKSLAPLADAFQAQVRRINELLAPHGARLMPGGMHPWMDPDRETKLWPHDSSEIYESFHRIFGCGGHGWSNLQSVHLNLPFADDAEFGRLHAAIRVLLPILPVLAASSPIVDGRVTGVLDARLDAYRENSRRIPSITGHVVPEAVFTEADYRDSILARLYSDIAPHDPQAILQHEWLNARGAIARFERNTIEVRVLDVQECPAADVAICGLATAALRRLSRSDSRASTSSGRGTPSDWPRCWPPRFKKGSARSSTTRSSSACSACAPHLRRSPICGDTSTTRSQIGQGERPRWTERSRSFSTKVRWRGEFCERSTAAARAARRYTASTRSFATASPVARCTCRSCTPGMTAVHCDRAMAFAWQAEDCLTYDWPSTW